MDQVDLEDAANGSRVQVESSCSVCLVDEVAIANSNSTRAVSWKVCSSDKALSSVKVLRSG